MRRKPRRIRPRSARPTQRIAPLGALGHRPSTERADGEPATSQAAQLAQLEAYVRANAGCITDLFRNEATGAQPR